MIRNLKTLGLALGAVLALGAMFASAASAQETWGQLTSDGPVTLTGTETNTGNPLNNSFTSFEKSVKCPGSTYAGHKYNETPHKLIPSGEKTVTITPKYINCETSDPFPATVDMNGCDYVFHAWTKTAAHLYDITTDIVCPEAKHIQVTVFSGSSHLFRVCTLTVMNFTDKPGLHATHNTEGDDIQLTGTIENITVKRSGLCESGAGHEANTDTKAIQHVDVTVKGHNIEGGDTPVTITDTVF